jgi:sarcosine oxidase subunit beta
VETTRGTIKAKKVGIVAAGHSSVLAQMAGIRLPLESHPLQALVSEPMKPIIHCVVMSNAVHAYISQSDKGDLVIGAGIDHYRLRPARQLTRDRTHPAGHRARCSRCSARAHEPAVGRHRGHLARRLPDHLGKTPVKGLFINCGWGTGGFKATPGSGWVIAHTGRDRTSRIRLNAAFSLDRFVTPAT